IVVYRGGTLPNLFTLAASPSVTLDGGDFGGCGVNAILVRDVEPGTHTVAMQTDIVAHESVTLAPGQTAYISCTMLPIGLFLPAPNLTLKQASEVPPAIMAKLS
ncbi:MAG: hypothetical protein P8X69_12265, partial [Maritimibacter sp.]